MGEREGFVGSRGSRTKPFSWSEGETFRQMLERERPDYADFEIRCNGVIVTKLDGPIPCNEPVSIRLAKEETGNK